MPCRFPWAAVVASGLLCAATVACSAKPSDDSEDDASALAAADLADGVDSEADDEGPGRRLELARLLAAHADPPTSAADVDADHDGDGIADALEEELLRRYRPYYRFSRTTPHGCLNDNPDCPFVAAHDEDVRPADPLDEIRHGRLATMKKDGDGTSAVIECGPLDRPDTMYTCRPDASLRVSRKKSSLCVDIDRARHGGVSLDEARDKATGIFGHVAPDTLDGHPAYKIEYWQFFAFNNQDMTFLGSSTWGDHDGDWTSVQLWFDRTLHRLTKILYLIHGHALSFSMPPSKPCKGCVISMKGSRFDPLVGNFLDDGDRKKYDDNMAEVFVDQNRFKHVVVYIEAGAHEFWPGAWGHASIDKWPLHVDLNPHNGAGTKYLVPDVTDRPLNLGEVDKPLTADASTVVSFNGFWGCTNEKGIGPLRKSPPGPALHCSWKWPAGAGAEGCED